MIHGADYATASSRARPRVHRDVIDTIRGGTALFAYYPDARWLASSPYLRCEAPSTIADATTERSALRNSSRLVAPLAALVGAR